MRDRPRPVVAYLVERGPTKTTAARPMATERGAYYRLAKSMMLRKYTRGDFPYKNPAGYHDQKMWATICRRLGKFLAFVDRRRAEFDHLDERALYDELERCERAAGVFMDRMVDINCEIARRGKSSTELPDPYPGRTR